MLIRLHEGIEWGERDARRVSVRAGEWWPAAGLREAYRAVATLFTRESVRERCGRREEPSGERLLEAVLSLELETILELVEVAQFSQVP